ncbi:MAG TPA: hypothetical protein VGG07_14225 [Solirubrobacteraceae bacterium]
MSEQILVHFIGGPLPFQPADLDALAVLDRIAFEVHPEWECYARPIADIEIDKLRDAGDPDPERFHWMLISQIAPGVRTHEPAEDLVPVGRDG